MPVHIGIGEAVLDDEYHMADGHYKHDQFKVDEIVHVLAVHRVSAELPLIQYDVIEDRGTEERLTVYNIQAFDIIPHRYSDLGRIRVNLIIL